jgi:hypothetical protein
MEMSSRTAGRIAWGLVALALISSIVGEGIGAAAGRAPDWFAFMVLMFPVVGALIVSRRPRNAVGWVMLGLGALIVVAEVLTAYVTIGLDLRPGSLPAPGAALALETAMWVPVIGLMGTFLILLFPDGHLPTARWRRWAWFCALAMVFSYLAIIIQPYEFLEEGYPGVSNPFGIEAMSESISGALLVVLISIPIAIVGCVVALIRRFRHSQGRTRVQLKWLVAAAATLGAVYGLSMFASLPFGVLGRETPAWIEATNNISILPFFFIPVAIGIAILRHRLYDIDLIINRALVYGVLTVMLTITYVVVIAVLQVVARPFAGESRLAIAGSTLAVAALFQPARVRIQAFIDRRFYRSKFDATKTLEAFSARLRDEVNIETLTADLLAVVDQTMSPAHQSLWLRDAGGRQP